MNPAPYERRSDAMAAAASIDFCVSVLPGERDQPVSAAGETIAAGSGIRLVQRRPCSLILFEKREGIRLTSCQSSSSPLRQLLPQFTDCCEGTGLRTYSPIMIVPLNKKKKKHRCVGQQTKRVKRKRERMRSMVLTMELKGENGIRGSR